MVQLRAMLKAKGLSTSGNKAELLNRLSSSVYAGKTRKQLKKELRKRGLSRKGDETAFRQRLETHDKRSAEAVKFETLQVKERWQTIWALTIRIRTFLDCPNYHADGSHTDPANSVPCFIQTAGEYETAILALCDSLIAIGSEDIVTPYLHGLFTHVPTMLNKWGSLAKFSTSAQELKNSLETMGQFRATNQKHVPESLLKRQLAYLYFFKHPVISK